MKTPILVLAYVLAFALAGCGGEDKPKVTEPTAPPSSLPAEVGTVQGQLLLVGGPQAESRPAPGKLKIVGGGTNITAEIGADGRYAIELAPGSYRITATTPRLNNGTFPCTTNPGVTTLVAGETVTTDVVCDAP